MKIWSLCLVGSLLLLDSVFCEVLYCPKPCVNGTISCTDDSGVHELTCSICDSRTRLTESQGVILSHDWKENNSGYSNLTSCNVVIESPQGTTIRLYISNFKTECAWDYLHFYDGVSPFDPTIGVYGGLLENDGIHLLKQSREIVSSDNRLLLVFRPDRFVNHDGFKIIYRVDGCPGDCSGHGTCTGGACTCDSDWTGLSCDMEKCQCGNGGVCVDGVCQCKEGFWGTKCDISADSNWWQHLKSTGDSPGGRASFGGALVGHEYWVFGGYHQDGVDGFVKMAKFDLLTKTWSKGTDSGPSNRNGHSLTAHEDNLYMFGGRVNHQISDELWKYDVSTSQWHQLNPQSTRISSMGHCAVLVNSTIYFIGGLDDRGVIIIDVQTYNIETNVWTIIGHRTMTRAFYDAASKSLGFTDGRVYHGRFGASCVHNPITDRITVYGGLNTTTLTDDTSLLSEEETVRESTFIEYDPYLNHWGNLYKADINSVPMVYLAGAGLLGQSLVVWGGRHFTTSQDVCYNTNAYIVNLETGEGRELTGFRDLEQVGPIRMGHGSFVHDNSIYFFGGYNGQLNDDFIIYHFSKCGLKTSRASCEEQREDFNSCSWDEHSDTCSDTPLNECGKLKCGSACIAGDGFDRRCAACQAAPGCEWDQNYPDTCRRSEIIDTTGFDDNYRCRNVPAMPKIKCSEYKLCEHCKGECYWDFKDHVCLVNVENAYGETSCEYINKPCSTLTRCDMCVSHHPSHSRRFCMWCALDQLNPDGSRVGQCVTTDTYLVRYPYGQCTAWATTSNPSCPAEEGCSGHGYCSLCQAQPECGWCDDASGTGTGTCYTGSFHSPMDHEACPATRWYYDTCPLCQCNGHSNCTDAGKCDKCDGQTTGAHCDSCIEGYYGNPVNNGLCLPCECGIHAKPVCDNLTGRCECDSWGVTGTKCDKCSAEFRRDNDDGQCYKQLRVDDPIKENNIKVQKMNIVLDLNSRVSHDVRVVIKTPLLHKFSLIATVLYADNTTYSTEKIRLPGTATWDQTYKKSSIGWNKRDAELRVSLDFTSAVSDPFTSISIQATHPNTQIDLKQFFIIFFSCIVILLLIFLLTWTAKIRYSQYRYQRSQEIQLMERALRPYQCHKILFREALTPATGRIFEVRPVCIEPLFEEKFAIVTHLMRMPGPKDVNLTLISGSFVSTLSYSKAISNPTINFEP